MLITTLSKPARRLKIIEGQIRGLAKMIEQDKYCIDVLTQSLAIQRSLGSVNKLILENHLKTCVKDQFSSTDPALQQKAIDELLNLYELGMVKGK